MGCLVLFVVNYSMVLLLDEKSVKDDNFDPPSPQVPACPRLLHQPRHTHLFLRNDTFDSFPYNFFLYCTKKMATIAYNFFCTVQQKWWQFHTTFFVALFNKNGDTFQCIFLSYCATKMATLNQISSLDTQCKYTSSDLL